MSGSVKKGKICGNCKTVCLRTYAPSVWREQWFEYSSTLQLPEGGRSKKKDVNMKI